MKFYPTKIEGLTLIKANVIKDERGLFTKNFESIEFKKNNLSVEFMEDYYSFSKAGVLRGMHFQLPPFDHHKVVYCTYGNIIDVVLDLRTNSTTYKQVFSIELSAAGGEMLYIPKGCAHGFWTISDSIVNYKVGTPYSPSHDFGVHWNSFDFNWPEDNPIVSSRDSKHIHLDNFRSPF